MARRFFQVALWAALIQTGIFSPCQAQTPDAQVAASPTASPSPSAPDDGRGERHGRQFRRENLTPEQQKKYDSLPPDQQQKMLENLGRWQRMSNDEKNAMREADNARHQKMLEEVEAAIKQSGLQLDDKTRDEYVMRYTEERRKIEQQLQKEMEEKRRPLVQALIDRLKTEFEARSSPAASPSASPAATSSPSK